MGKIKVGLQPPNLASSDPFDPRALAALEEGERRRLMVAKTGRFAASFVRWVGVPPGRLTFAQLRLLQVLHQEPPTIMRELCARLGVSPRNMTAMVDGLESEGLVARRPHPTDRRAFLVELTSRGARAAGKAVKGLDQLGSVFEGFSLAEQQRLLAAFGRLYTAMGVGACQEEIRT